MLAMDVVDTLRHERMLITRDINTEVRRESLVDRLRDIYRGQGISVPDDILMDGVKALEEERFRYTPPADGFGTKLARIYIGRRRWMPFLLTLLGIVGFAGAINYVAFEQPASQREAQVGRALETMPGELDALYQDALEGVRDSAIIDSINNLRAEIQSDLDARDIAGAELGLEELAALDSRLDQTYELNIINRAGELSGVDYTANGETFYYLIVEATDATGAAVRIPVTSEITGRTNEVSTFGQRVPQSVFEAVGADYTADNIVDDTLIGEKIQGELEPDFVMDVQSGRITEWR